MKQTEEQYANELIKRYNSIMIGFAFKGEISIRNKNRFILLAIQDVENTIEALEFYYEDSYNENNEDLEDNEYELINKIVFYQNVLQILKDKL